MGNNKDLPDSTGDVSAESLLSEFSHQLDQVPTDLNPAAPPPTTELEATKVVDGDVKTEPDVASKDAFLKLVGFIKSEQKKKKSANSPQAQLQMKKVQAYEQQKPDSNQGPKNTKGLQINKAA